MFIYDYSEVNLWQSRRQLVWIAKENYNFKYSYFSHFTRHIMDCNRYIQRFARYQIEQERLPNVVCLNQEVVLQFEVDSFYDVIKDYSAIKNANLRIYNLGVGTAQNCEMSWDIESIKRACLSIKELLTDSSVVQEVEGVRI